MRCNRKPAIVLTSGGLDSTTCLAIARDAHFQPLYSMSFDYGQRHRQELAAAAKVAKHFGCVEHRVIQIDLRQFGKSALTDDIDVPKDRDETQMSAQVPITYVPARNTIFLSYALAWAEVLDCRDVFIGVNAIDYSGYPDCRPEFIEAFERLANLATRMTLGEGSGFRVQGSGNADARNPRDDASSSSLNPEPRTLRPLTIHAPLIRLSKAQIIRRGVELGVDYSMTHSCYDPDAQGRACGRCDSCLLRKKGFAEAGVDDPTVYVQTTAII